MTSQALLDWQTTRSHLLDELWDAHAKVGGTGSGRRWRTEQLNWSLVMRIAGEFQGFARDLHDESVDYFASQVSPLNASAQTYVSAALTRSRDLDRGNANAKSLGADFGRFGILFWKELDQRWTTTQRVKDALEALNSARNGIAHHDAAKIAKSAQDGWPLSQLATAQRFRTNTGLLAERMDRVMADFLQNLFGGAKPW
jgi:hypothetical protein